LNTRFRSHWLVLATAVTALGGCGGGGSSQSSVAPPPPSDAASVAATATATNNPLCKALGAYYWEIGDVNGRLASGSIGGVSATTVFNIASASKWIYGAYVVQKRGGVNGLNGTGDVPFLNFTSGFANMGNVATALTCFGTVDTCLLANHGDVLLPTKVSSFDYDSGHMQQHAAVNGLGGMDDGALSAAVSAELGVTVNYSLPLLAGGVESSATGYAAFLRKILDGSLLMHDALGAHTTCTNPNQAGCNASYSPIDESSNESWHYSMGHWVEDDPSVNGDGAFSSAGAFGFYPWIDATKTHYGVIAREDASLGTQHGYESAKCGRLIRHAYATGTEQTGTVPSN
jgi:CubicO group peptidase (beta-lactamase class C family)